MFINLSEGKKHDLKAAKEIVFPKGSVLVADRAYQDSKWLNELNNCGVSFVTRLKTNTKSAVIKELLVGQMQEHILSDQEIELYGLNTSKNYTGKLRLVRVYDKKKQENTSIDHQQLILDSTNHLRALQGSMGHRNLL